MRPNIATETDQTMMLIVGVSFLLLLLIGVAMIYFVFRYSKKRNPVPADISGHTGLEIAWTVIPILLVLVMFFYGWRGFTNLRSVPEGAMVVKVTGQMWKWTFQYANGKNSDTLYVPVNSPVKMEINSNDVNHSFFIPSLRVKEDAIPGRVNHLWFEATELGLFPIACAEYCGMNHSYMYTRLKVIPAAEFQAWYNTKDSTMLAADSLKNNTTTAPVTTPPADTSANKTPPVKTGDTSAIKKDTVKKDTTKK